MKTRKESLQKSIADYKAQLLVCLSDYQAERLKAAIKSMERALGKDNSK